jgi:hypothetical protein
MESQRMAWTGYLAALRDLDGPGRARGSVSLHGRLLRESRLPWPFSPRTRKVP